CSKRWTCGPCVTQPDRITSRTARASSSPRIVLASGIVMNSPCPAKADLGVARRLADAEIRNAGADNGVGFCRPEVPAVQHEANAAAAPAGEVLVPVDAVARVQN